LLFAGQEVQIIILIPQHGLFNWFSIAGVWSSFLFNLYVVIFYRYALIPQFLKLLSCQLLYGMGLHEQV
jgi:hypothetical protein